MNRPACTNVMTAESLRLSKLTDAEFAQEMEATRLVSEFTRVIWNGTVLPISQLDEE